VRVISGEMAWHQGHLSFSLSRHRRDGGSISICAAPQFSAAFLLRRAANRRHGVARRGAHLKPRAGGVAHRARGAP
jgi:hypothetical protein